MADYKNPTPTVDIIIEVDDRIVLIRRKNEPHGWALPGGFVDEGETVESAAVREADEETNLEVTLEELLYVYSHPARDPRQHTMSTAFVASARGEPRGADDAQEARLFGRDELPEDIVFDHERILNHYFRFRDTGERPSPSAELERFRNS
ncbi:NUDIX hydrolase [Persicimonas caeni]|uniref:NUDIX hydrolase n=1 Tax=Persicimonas caeni TaxID=2292766 RepID=A0A4Y6Q1N4_PERCE|nr:NUDIX hydrolase [Persicimonas caeni]QDG54486.1 NUDIX hydrolase [Persicimonas caeni]QED35707.1 NUDIX hydrolase [Persicimonas caeni]